MRFDKVKDSAFILISFHYVVSISNKRMKNDVKKINKFSLLGMPIRLFMSEKRLWLIATSIQFSYSDFVTYK